MRKKPVTPAKPAIPPTIYVLLDENENPMSDKQSAFSATSDWKFHIAGEEPQRVAVYRLVETVDVGSQPVMTTVTTHG